MNGGEESLQQAQDSMPCSQPQLITSQGVSPMAFPTDLPPKLNPGCTPSQQPTQRGAEGTIRGGALFASLARLHSSGGSGPNGSSELPDSGGLAGGGGGTYGLANGPPGGVQNKGPYGDAGSSLGLDASARSNMVISPHMFQLLWDVLPLAVFIRDRDGHILYANARGQQCTCPCRSLPGMATAPTAPSPARFLLRGSGAPPVGAIHFQYILLTLRCSLPATLTASGARVAGCAPGVLPAPWQITPRHGPR